MKLHTCAAVGLGVGLLVFAPLPLCAQAPAPSPAVVAPNAVIFELFGNGIVYSVNYERALTPRAGVRAGVMYLQLNNNQDNGFSYGGSVTLVPLMVHYLTGARNNHLELGAGIVLARGTWHHFDTLRDRRESGQTAFGTATIGYRYQNPAGRNMFRVGFTPLFNGSGGLPWFGVSYGRRW